MKVIFLDTWTVGIGNFVPIARSLNAQGVTHMLIHRGSQGAEPGRPNEETIKGVLCRDIAYYQTNLIHKVLEAEKPDVVLLLTTFYLMDRAIISSARSLGIKTVFLMPGIREVDEEYIRTTEYEIKFKQLNSLRHKISKFPKYLKYVLPNYIYSGSMADKHFVFRRRTWGSLLELAMNPGRKVLYPTPCKEIHCDVALVYARAYGEFFTEKYGYPTDRVKITGNPALDYDQEAHSALSRNAKIERLKQEGLIASSLPVVCYLATPFVEARYEGWTVQNRLDQLAEFAACARKAGCQFVIKLHPSMDETEFLPLLSLHEHVTVLKDTDLARLVSASSAVIGHHSTTLLLPIVMKVPLLIPRWGRMAQLNDRFSRHDLSVPVHGPDDLTVMLKDAHAGNVRQPDNHKSRAYLEDFVTYLDGQSTARVVSQIVN